MKYRVEIDGQEREVDVQMAGDTVAVSLDGKSVDARVHRVPGGLNLIIGGKVYDVMFGGTAEKLDVAAGATRLRTSALSERHRGRKGRGSGSGGAGELRSPMPGRIVSVSVEVGQDVKPGDPLVVIEAMKMQNELRSEVAGTVSKVAVSEEQSVEADVLLVAIDVAG